MQTDDGFPGFGIFMPASGAFQTSEGKKRIIEQKIFDTAFFLPFKDNIRSTSGTKKVLLWTGLEICLGGVSACNEMFFLNFFLKRNFLPTWS